MQFDPRALARERVRLQPRLAAPQRERDRDGRSAVQRTCIDESTDAVQNGLEPVHERVRRDYALNLIEVGVLRP